MTQPHEITATVKTGEEFSVEFNEMASAGYLWSAEAGEGLKVTKKTGAPGPGFGAALNVKFAITADKPGVYNIDFTYKRPWENEADEQVRYVLTVKP